MSDLLNIGASGVRAYQSALTVVSDNIANVGTTGYVKRTTSLAEVASSGRSIIQRNLVDGNGVLATGVQRSVDELKAGDVRSAGADLARTQTGITWLDRIQGALTGNQLGDQLTGFFTSATALAADPSATAARATMLQAATSVAGSFAATGKAIDDVAADLDATAGNAVSTLNSLGTALAKINDGLGRSQPGTSGAANLLDQRDQILDQMSAISDVSVSTDAIGRASVRLGGSGGPTLVSGINSGFVTYARDATTGAVGYAVHFNGNVTALSPAGGALAGIVDGAGRIAAARGQLNDIATSFTTGVNAAQASGDDANGQTGTAMFTTGASPTDVSLALTDPSQIAAAAHGGGVRDNSNLAAFAALRSGSGVETRTTTLVADNAAALAGRQQVANAQGAIHDSAVSARDSVSGVNLDSEAVDLMRYQQAYSACSRVIQVARETFQSILDIH